MEMLDARFGAYLIVATLLIVSTAVIQSRG